MELLGLIPVCLGVLLSVIKIHITACQFRNTKTEVSDNISYYGWKFGYICFVLLLILLNLYLDSNDSQSQEEGRSGYVNKDELTASEYRRSQPKYARLQTQDKVLL